MEKIYYENMKEKKGMEGEKLILTFLAESRPEFMRRLDLKVYESEEGEYFFEFGDVIENLTKLFLEKKLDYEIKEKKVHRKIGGDRNVEGRYVENKELRGVDLSSLKFLKIGFSKWKKSVAAHSFVSQVHKAP